MGGVFFSWIVLGGVRVLLRGVDFILGGFLLLVGGVVYFLGRFSYSVFVFLSGVGFAKWISTGGFSRCFSMMSFHRGDCSWMEILGGGGVYRFLFRVGGTFGWLFSFGFKGLGLVIFSSVFFFYF